SPRDLPISGHYLLLRRRPTAPRAEKCQRQYAERSQQMKSVPGIRVVRSSHGSFPPPSVAPRSPTSVEATLLSAFLTAVSTSCFARQLGGRCVTTQPVGLAGRLSFAVARTRLLGAIRRGPGNLARCSFVLVMGNPCVNHSRRSRHARQLANPGSGDRS